MSGVVEGKRVGKGIIIKNPQTPSHNRKTKMIWQLFPHFLVLLKFKEKKLLNRGTSSRRGPTLNLVGHPQKKNRKEILSRYPFSVFCPPMSVGDPQTFENLSPLRVLGPGILLNPPTKTMFPFQYGGRGEAVPCSGTEQSNRGQAKRNLKKGTSKRALVFVFPQSGKLRESTWKEHLVPHL